MRRFDVMPWLVGAATLGFLIFFLTCMHECQVRSCHESGGKMAWGWSGGRYTSICIEQ